MDFCSTITHATGWLNKICANPSDHPILSSIYSRMGEKISSVFGNATIELMSYDTITSGFETVDQEKYKFINIKDFNDFHEVNFGVLQPATNGTFEGKTWSLSCLKNSCSSETISLASKSLDFCPSDIKTAFESLKPNQITKYWITTNPALSTGTMNGQVLDNNPELPSFSHYLEGKRYVDVSLSDYALPIAKLATGVAGAAFCGYKCFREVSQLVSDYKKNRASEQTEDKPKAKQETGSKAKALAYMVGTLAFGTLTAMTAINDFSDTLYATSTGGWVKFV